MRPWCREHGRWNQVRLRKQIRSRDHDLGIQIATQHKTPYKSTQIYLTLHQLEIYYPAGTSPFSINSNKDLTPNQITDLSTSICKAEESLPTGDSS